MPSQRQVLRTEVIWMFILSFALLIGLQALSAWSEQQTDAARDQARRSAHVVTELEKSISDLKDVETGVRGYALTNQPSFLEPFNWGVPNVRRDLTDLKNLMRDPIQQQGLARLSLLADERIAIGQDIIRFENQGNIGRAMQGIREGAGKQTMDAARRQVDAMQQRESAIATGTENKAQAAAGLSRNINFFGFIAALVLQTLAFFLVSREMKQRQDAEKSVKKLNQELEGHVRELDNEIVERRKAEAHVQRLNEQLQEQLELLNETNTNLNAVNKELESFAYSVSHDLRSPLRGIDGFSQAILEDYGDKLDAVGKDFLGRIRKESQRMGDLIDGILSLSRLTRGEIHVEPVDLSQMAHKIADELESQESKRNVAFDIQDGLTAEADPRLILAVLQNLIANAWKFTSRHAQAHIAFGARQEDGKPVYYVKDDGAGFDMAYIGKMFGAFQRLHGVQEFPGSGIGLATVQRIIHRHGGKIWAEGAIEKGASFYFTLS